MTRDRIDLGLMIGGGALLALGSFLPWAKILGRGVSGINGGDGWMTLVAALFFVGFAVRLLVGDDDFPLWFPWSGLLVSVAVAGVNLLDILDTGGEDVAVGFGMMLMVLGGFVGLLGLGDYSWRGRESTQTN